ncbi:hypothetical protein SAMN05444277_10343 [Parafilimonas terrae]|jgi:hypothetical protein|uniref:Uncharacterized protein n=1 Tax=Parafilimonas terrae TaxID=1465490 RepID=A0A1I5U4H0_9BACT|nr:hypothetical protein SAMN05444277_10343 [Parafilimonas terrae]
MAKTKTKKDVTVQPTASAASETAPTGTTKQTKPK